MNGDEEEEDKLHRQHRSSVKEVSAAAQRRAMNVRRHEISAQIRKAKRSHVVQLKRRLTSSVESEAAEARWATAANATATAPSSSQKFDLTDIGAAPMSETALQVKLYDVASAFLRASQSRSTNSDSAQSVYSTLCTFQRILSKAPTACIVASLASFFTPNQPGDGTDTPSRAFLLCQTLAHMLLSAQDFPMQIEVAKVLTNLAAVSESAQNLTSSTNNDDLDYYNGQQMQMMHRYNWCDLMLQTQAMTALIHILSTFVASATPPISADKNFVLIGTTQQTLDLSEQCCWALGNLAGDSQKARDAIKAAGGIPYILATLRLSFKLAGFSSSLNAIALCRDAAWAAANLARGTLSSAIPFLAMTTSGSLLQTNPDSTWLLLQDDFYHFLTCIELHSHESDTYHISWYHVCFEMCWLLAFLTAKEDAVVDFLCHCSHTETSMIAAVLFRLSNLQPLLSDSDSLRIAIPLIRIVGNIATACDGKFVPLLLNTHAIIVPSTSSNSLLHFSPLSQSLATFIETASHQSDFHLSTVAAEASWAAGALLCDTGYPQHPSTVAASFLIPSLSLAVTSGHSNLELKREAIAAVRNAISTPPNSLDSATDKVRDDILSSLASSRIFVRTVVDLLQCPDTDAIHSSLQIIQGFLKRLGHVQYIRTWLDEIRCKDALESICDRASLSPSCGQNYWVASDSGLQGCADLAADLIDDYFDMDPWRVDEDDESGDEVTMSPPPTSLGRGRGLAMTRPAWMH